MPRSSFREQMLRVREDAIVTAVNRLLAEKGFDLMTVDQVAAEVGIAKASLYKHFPSKEALAAAAMVRVMEQGLRVVDEQADHGDASVLDRLKAVARWALRTQLAGQMPTLPSQNSSLRAELAVNARYMEMLMELSDKLGAWIVQAQREGALDPALPAELVLYTLYARACDPVPAVLKSGGRFTDDEVVDWVITTCFCGLKGQG